MTVDVSPIQAFDGAPLRFRIDVLRRGTRRQFGVRVWRTESFRLAAPFGGKKVPRVSDEVILVEDDQHDWSDIKSRTPRGAVRSVLHRLRAQLFVT